MRKGKKLLVWLAILALSAGALAEASAPVPGNRLGFRALSVLADGVDNAFVSPVSLAYALSMAAAGAKGAAREALLSALEAGAPQDVAALNGGLRAAGLRWANAAFVDSELPLEADYRETLGRDFEAELFTLEDAAQVDAWVADKTDGLIEGMDGLIGADTALLLLNAVAMDAEWEYPFEARDTFQGVFHAPAGQKDVSYMNRCAPMEYAEVDGAQITRLDYRDSGLYMLLILPPKDGMDAMLDRLAAEGLGFIDFQPRPPEDIAKAVIDWYGLENDLREQEEVRNWFNEPEMWKVDLTLPRFDIGTSWTLRSVCQALSLESAFAADADYTGVTALGATLDDVLQKVRVQVDEEGTRAAAAIEVFVAYGSGRYTQPPVEMTLDRPFIAVIADEDTGAVCFAGVVARP